MATNTSSVSPALSGALRASSTLARSLVGKADDSPIETDVRSLRGLAEVIDALVEEAKRCGGPDCMGRAVDGVKLWVTQDRLAIEAERSAAASARLARYEDALRTIGEVQLLDPGGLDMLVDWHGVALQLRDVAQRALASSVEA